MDRKKFNLKLTFDIKIIVWIFCFSFYLLSFFFLNPESRNYFQNRKMSFTGDIQTKVFVNYGILVTCLILMNIWNKYSLLLINKILSVRKFFFFPLTLILLYILSKIQEITLTSEFFYKFFRISYYVPSFGDFRTIIYGITCPNVKKIGDLISCDERGSYVSWNYPTWLLHLRKFLPNYSESLVSVLAIIALILFLYSLNLYSKTLPLVEKNYFYIVLLSPPLLLGLERLNFDVIIFALLLLAVSLKKSISNELISIFALFLASLLKFYAVIFIFVRAIFEFKQKTKWRYHYLLTLFLVIGLEFKDFSNLNKYVGKDLVGSVGLPVLFGDLDGAGVAKFFSIKILGLILIGLVVSISILKKIRTTSSFTLDSKKFQILCEFGFTFFFAWAVSSNYYYRMLLIVPIIAYLLSNSKNQISQSFGFLGYLILFMSPSSIGILQNIFLFLFIVYCGVSSFRVNSGATSSITNNSK